jgi:hypothetical protein
VHKSFVPFFVLRIMHLRRQLHFELEATKTFQLHLSYANRRELLTIYAENRLECSEMDSDFTAIPQSYSTLITVRLLFRNKMSIKNTSLLAKMATAFGSGLLKTGHFGK